MTTFYEFMERRAMKFCAIYLKKARLLTVYPKMIF